MAETWNKREREQKKKNAKKQKEEKRLERKESASKNKSLDDMIAYVDEFGNLSNTPPERKAVTLDDIPPTVANSRELNNQSNTRTGTVDFFDTSKGYGFIKDAQTGERIFVHVSEATFELKEQIKLSFEVQKGPKGLVAVNLTRL